MRNRRVRASAPARVALAGNPSDGYGGGTLALAIGNFGAEVEVRASRHPDLPDGEGGRLVRAALRCLAREAGCADLDEGVAVAWRTTIPREVGLGGSSAVITAALRAFACFFELNLPAERVPALALSVEVDELGIAAGPQDRVAQAFGGLVHVEAGTADTCVWERLEPASLPPLFVAHLAGAPQPSHRVHADLRRRFDAGEPDVVDAMSRLRVLAAQARGAALAGDRDALGRAMDRSFDVRRSIAKLDPRHAGLVELARRHGAAANFAGSGGAIAGLAGDDGDLAAIGRAFAAAGHAFELLRPGPAAGARAYQLPGAGFPGR